MHDSGDRRDSGAMRVPCVTVGTDVTVVLRDSGTDLTVVPCVTVGTAVE